MDDRAGEHLLIAEALLSGEMPAQQERDRRRGGEPGPGQPGRLLGVRHRAYGAPATIVKIAMKIPNRMQ